MAPKPVIAVYRLTLHENLFFATREIGRLYETGRYLHNYALSYALGLAVAPYHSPDATPRYADDLAALNAAGIYVTPARPLGVEFELVTFKCRQSLPGQDGAGQPQHPQLWPR